MFLWKAIEIIRKFIYFLFLYKTSYDFDFAFTTHLDTNLQLLQVEFEQCHLSNVIFSHAHDLDYH